MSTFFLADLISDSSSTGFDKQLREKLVSPSDSCFNAVRCLFQEAASALEKELAGDINSCLVRAHWNPGRIEVMGKHTDYAGGNSLVCSTEGRGMAMVSTMTPTADRQRRITVVSILTDGMEHHSTNSAAPFVINGRTVVHHTINIDEDDKNNECNTYEDWRIYPTTTIRRIQKNIGLEVRPRQTSATTTSEEAHHEKKGYHIIIAISSNLPPASGLSTSSCFVTGLFLALKSHLNLESSQTYRQAIGTVEEEETVCNLATYLGNIENGMCYTKQRTTIAKNVETNSDKRNLVLEGTKQGDGVGTFGGSEDHAAILMGRKGKLRLLSFCPTRPASFAVKRLHDLVVCNSEDFDRESMVVNLDSELELPSSLVFVIAYSGARAEKAGKETEASMGYNYASNMASSAAKAYNACKTDVMNTNERRIHTLADAIRYERRTLSCDDQIKKSISEKILTGSATVQDHVDVEGFGQLLVKRFEQFYEESELFVPAVAYCLAESSRLGMLGPIVDKSHKNAVNILQNQIEETAWLPLWARGIEHQLQTKPVLYINDGKRCEQTQKNHRRIAALASSAFGAGFGGSCWALVHRNEAKEFLLQWRDAYDEAFPANESREFFITEPGPGAFSLA